jgi:hypothetical protein
MKLRVGMYVRTKHGIRKITEIDEDKNYYIDETYINDFVQEINCINDNCIIGKPSFNITDLIKSKDIILGKDGRLYQCWKRYKDYVFTYSKNKQGQTITLVDYQIDKILTKEEFEQMSYNVGD